MSPRSVEETVRTTVVAFLALILVGCGKEGITPPNNPSPTPAPTPAPTPQNRAPTITAMNFAPTFGISGLTQFSFNASATDPDGDAVSFAWDVAGNAFTGSNGAATFSGSATPGTARLTVTDARGLTTSDSRTFTVGSMSGAWTVTTGPLQGATFNLTQTNTGIVTGTFNLPGIGTGNTDPAQPGRIDAGATLTMRVKIGAFTDFNMNGRMLDTGRRVDGTLQGSGFNGQPFTMTK
jgi:hypothetical protein